MNDLLHFWGNDLSVCATGDLSVASQTVTGEQRVLRRLLTNPEMVDDSGSTQASGDCTFHPTYGAGLPRVVGNPVDVAGTTAVIVSQLGQEQAVASSPAPVIALNSFRDGMNAFIQYNDANSKLPVILDFDVTK